MTDKEWITDEDLPLEYHFAKLDSGSTTTEALFQEACDTFERNFILRALEKSDWNVTATARYLGNPAQHPEAQDVPPRSARHREEAPRRLIAPRGPSFAANPSRTSSLHGPSPRSHRPSQTKTSGN